MAAFGAAEPETVNPATHPFAVAQTSGAGSRDSSGKSPGNHGRSSFGVPNGGLEDQQKVEKVLDFSCIYDIT